MKIKKSEIILTDSEEYDDYCVSDIYIVQEDFDICEVSKRFRNLHFVQELGESVQDTHFYEWLVKGGFIKRVSYINCGAWHQRRKGGLRLCLSRDNTIINVSLRDVSVIYDKEGYIV